MRHQVAARLFGAVGAAAGPARLGRFELRRHVGRGATGEVHAAWDPKLEREVALKLLSDRSLHGQDDPILREARAAAGVRHPNVASIFEIAEHDGQTFLAMELVEGPPVMQWARRAPISERLRAVVDIARGIAAAHDAGVMHGDIKPANLLVDEQGDIKIGDFGLARVMHRHTDESRAAGGTPAYADPRLLEGETPDFSHDQYAFGITALELLAGRHPHAGRPADFEQSARLGRPPGVPKACFRVLLRCVSPPSSRFESMSAVAAALEHARGQGRRRLVAGLSALSVGAIGVALWSVNAGGPSCPTLSPDDVLSADRLATVVSAFEPQRDGGSTWRSKAGSETQQQLARRASTLAATRTRVCVARDVEARLSDDAAAQMERCLDRRENELRSFVDAMREPSPDLLRAAARAAMELPDPADCERVQPNVDGAPTPASAYDRELEAELLRAQLEIVYGHYAPLQETLAALKVRVDAAVDRRVVALWHLVDAQLAQRLADPTRERRAASQAMVAAAETGDRRRQAEAAVALAWAEGYLARDVESAEAWIDVARDVARRDGDPVAVTARIDDVAGTIAFVAGDAERAARLHRAAVDRWGDEGPALPRARSLTNLGADLQSLQRSAEAVEALQSAQTMIASTAGDDHPELGPVLTNLSYALLDAGRPKDAFRTARRALAIKRAVHGEGHVRLASSYSAVGTCAWSFDLDAAAEAYGQGLAILEQHFATDDPRLFSANANLCAAQLLRGEGDLALQHARVMRGIAQGFEPTDERRVMAEAYADAASSEAATDPSEVTAARTRLIALVSREDAGLSQPDRALLAYFAARAALAMGQPRSTAIDLATLARRLNDGADPPLDAAIDGWLADRPR